MQTETLTHCASPAELTELVERWQVGRTIVGLVPTMGALHDGHRSLIRRARDECHRVVVSIFVNPRQFAASEDLKNYPQPLEADLEICTAEGVDAVFVPTVEAMYPGDGVISLIVGGPLGNTLEGAHRPGHLDGVALVVAKLLIASRCHRVYFGRKDAQQLAMVTQLIRDLDIGCEVVPCPVVRDRDGVALSSRNRYLTPEQRLAAQAIPRALRHTAERFLAGERQVATLLAAAEAALGAGEAVIPDYVAVVDDHFRPVEEVAFGNQLVIAAKIGTTRLIDCLRLGVDPLPSGDGDGADREAVPDPAGHQHGH